MIFKSNLNDDDIAKLCGNNTYINDSIRSWNLFKTSQNINTIQKMIIWNNSEIRINNETLYYKMWHDKGIIYLEH